MSICKVAFRANCQTNNERYIFTGNNKKAQVQTIMRFKLTLDFSFILILKNTFIISFFKRNLIVSCLNKSNFSCSFENETFSFFF